MLLTLEQAWAPVLGAGVGGPVLVAAGGLVVVLAILLVFLMVLRSNGDARKMSSGVGYDGQHGPPGQPRAPVSQPSRQAWGAEGEYAAPAGGQGSWGAQPSAGQWQDPNAGGGWNGAPAQQPSWGGAPAQQQQPAWGAPAQPSWGGAQQQQQQPGWGGAPAQQPAQPSWGGAQQQQQPGWGGAQQQQQQPGWGAPAATAQGQEWGAPMGQPNYGAGGFGAQPGAQPGAQRMGVLVVRQGKEPGRTFEMRKDRITIGRSRDSDIFLEDLAVSRLHTTVGRDASGRYIVHDENSANGTFVNGQRISEHVLEEGDEVQVGQTVLQFVRR